VYIQLGLQVDMNLQFAGPRIRLLALRFCCKAFAGLPLGCSH
jgi:hypothetical protein